MVNNDLVFLAQILLKQKGESYDDWLNRAIVEKIKNDFGLTENQIIVNSTLMLAAKKAKTLRQAYESKLRNNDGKEETNKAGYKKWNDTITALLQQMNIDVEI